MDWLDKLIKDFCDGTYPVSEDGIDANGRTYKDFAKAIRVEIEKRTFATVEQIEQAGYKKCALCDFYDESLEREE